VEVGWAWAAAAAGGCTVPGRSEAASSACGATRAADRMLPAADSWLSPSAISRCSGPMYDEPVAREI
jgi:hypothetical protein